MSAAKSETDTYSLRVLGALQAPTHEKAMRAHAHEYINNCAQSEGTGAVLTPCLRALSTMPHVVISQCWQLDVAEQIPVLRRPCG